MEDTRFYHLHISMLIAAYLREMISDIIDNCYYGNRKILAYRKNEIAKTVYIKSSDEKYYLYKLNQCCVRSQIEISRILLYLKRHDRRNIIPYSKYQNKANDEVVEISKN